MIRLDLIMNTHALLIHMFPNIYIFAWVKDPDRDLFTRTKLSAWAEFNPVRCD
jgi:hypothetical protein